MYLERQPVSGSCLDEQNPGTLVQDVTYRYDVHNRRISKTIDADGAGLAGAETTWFVHDGDRIAMQFNWGRSTGQTFLYGPAVDQVLANMLENGAVFWSLGDHQGSVRDIVNDVGSPFSQITYNAFGEVIAENNPMDFLFGYTGAVRDQETGYGYHRARYLAHGTGRWLSEDPIGFWGDPSNRTRYVDNNPLIATDPSGLDEYFWNSVDGQQAHYAVVKGNYSLIGSLDPLYPGEWGQLATQTSGSFSFGNGAATTVNLNGGNVCNTIVPTGSTHTAGEIRASVRVDPGCYDVLWMWEVGSSGNAKAGTVTVTTPGGDILGTTTLTPGFHDGGVKTTRVNNENAFFRKTFLIATYSPQLSRTTSAGNDGQRAHSSTTGRITILSITEVE